MNVPATLLAAFIFMCSQVVLSELILGLSGILHKESLFCFNALLSILTLFILFRWKKEAWNRLFASNSPREGIDKPPLLDGYNYILSLLVLFSYTIVLAASYFLPPRGIDDLFYHLPVISEYARSHAIHMLSLDVREAFAYPQNAELLFLWPLIFSGSMKWIDSANIPFVFMSVLAVYAFLKSFQVTNRDSLFHALLYALCPVVLMQAGTNYIDIILTFFLLTSLYFSIEFFRHGRNCHLWFAAMAIGMASGMKYTALFLALPLHLLIFVKLYNGKRKFIPGYVLLVSIFSGFWYVRNLFVLGNPFFPMNPFVSGMGFMGGSGQSNILMDILSNMYDWFWMFPLADIGLGSFDGGFGAVFWGLGFPSWLVISILSIRRYETVDIPLLLTLFFMPMGIFILLLVPKNSLIFNGRYALVIVPIGLLAISLLLKVLEDQTYKKTIKLLCVVFSLMSVCLLASTNKPSYRFDQILSSKYLDKIEPEYLFSMNTYPFYETLRHIWSPLDLLTRNDKPGINCYLASIKPYLALAPIYGSNLQNNPITIGDEVPSQPEAYVFLFRTDRSSFSGSDNEMFYPSRKVTPEEIMTNPDYVMVSSTGLGWLFMSREYLTPSKINTLRKYYNAVWPHSAEDYDHIAGYLQPGIPLISSDVIIYGGLYKGSRRANVDQAILVPSGYEKNVAESRGLKSFYTLAQPVSGYESSKIASVMFEGSLLELFINQKVLGAMDE